ncbi:MAG TPA: peptidoglycan-binding protein [Epulopiscium sp.]|nr:peptidoglycan-binding protein [Candidatus Epulonipiscium sp.]
MSRQTLGELIVDVSTNQIIAPLFPIPGTPVSIIERTPSGEERVIEELITNDSGQTPVISLPAPPEDLSLDPLNTIKPFSSYIIQANPVGYNSVRVEGSQIFAGVRSIQPIQPVGLPRMTRQEQIYIIGPPTLFGDFPPKIPEAELKPTGPASGLVVLDSPIVPEYIIVHDGVPNNVNAPSYRIPYRDYIKNVASSEIFPTWPRSTIEANVLAIVSFTLNRVYTEWYRNQGKAFTITSSTAYDHAFFNGRNIFDSISLVVDDLFSTYILRASFTQPLLTQYCDGVQVQCPTWMTQWGSKNLGQQGKSAIEILRAYYGSNISLTTAPQVQGSPESYPGTPLQLGSSGPAVRTIQNQLNNISRNFPKIPKVATDGNFGPGTETSVKTFQEVFHLTPDGIVGRGTWYKLSQVYVGVTQLGELI